jgi:hypothetical protein
MVFLRFVPLSTTTFMSSISKDMESMLTMFLPGPLRLKYLKATPHALGVSSRTKFSRKNLINLMGLVMALGWHFE